MNEKRAAPNFFKFFKIQVVRIRRRIIVDNLENICGKAGKFKEICKQPESRFVFHFESFHVGGTQNPPIACLFSDVDFFFFR